MAGVESVEIGNCGNSMEGNRGPNDAPVEASAVDVDGIGEQPIADDVCVVGNEFAQKFGVDLDIGKGPF